MTTFSTPLSALQLFFAGCRCTGATSRIHRNVLGATRETLSALDTSPVQISALDEWQGVAADKYRSDLRSANAVLGGLSADARRIYSLVATEAE
ncbi:MAG: hypothetical protein LKJ44_03890 [Bifidobacteriaceae bacterium]|jgi:hypothetical protein|nr:hypothetical protein [Bifidobacteriaceae bacterium]MCI1978840.1 hypothetical protein [Bifidobacteriaceae bacterium]